MAKTRKRRPRQVVAKDKRKVRRSAASHAKVLRGTLATVSPHLHPSRSDIGGARAVGGAVAFEGLEAAAGAGLTFVAVVSNDGPWELRSLVINDFQVLDTTIPTSERRIDVPIPAVLGSPLKITWAILAGQLIPSLGTFVEAAGEQPTQLATKGPLKKGESWAPLLPVTFPKE